jgi:predicted Zn-dependent protease
VQAVFHSKHASAVEVEVKIVQGEIQFYDSFSWQYVRANDILEVSYPAKNQALLILEGGTLLIKAPNIRGTLNHFLGSFNEKLPRSERWMKRGLAPLILVGCFILAAILLFYFFILPWLADRAAMNFPKEQEIALGAELKKQYLLAERIDTQKTRLLNEFASKLDLGKDYPADYTVVDDDIVNAYALPGGPIVVYAGIIRKMQTPEELAGILAHERSHVLRHHSTRSIFQNVSGVLLINLVLGDASSLINLIAQNGQQIQQLSYSRELELEADREGLQLLLKNDINPKGMLSLLEKLKHENSGSSFPEFLRTHPLPDSRIEALKKLLVNHTETTTHSDLDSIWLKLKLL